jgi:hypothetical protein
LKELEKEHQNESIAFELLGPPRLSKLLFEAHLLKLIAGSAKEVLKYSPRELSDKSLEIIKNNINLRTQMLSIGLVILLPDGKTYLRGKEVKIPLANDSGELDFTPENLERWCAEGWVDLRESNFLKWQERIKKIMEQIETQPKDDTSSQFNYNSDFWNNFDTIEEGKLIAWIFENEDKGWRFKR